MHIGPYEDELETIARLHEFIREGGYEMRGLHHEIYLEREVIHRPQLLLSHT
jgi:hypothetical protein